MVDTSKEDGITAGVQCDGIKRCVWRNAPESKYTLVLNGPER